MGSVKDLIIEEEATEERLGRGDFDFSNDFSVFDHGKMPDSIPNKGAALCMMGARNFESLREQGLPSHYLGLRDSNGGIVSLSELTAPTNVMAVSLSRVVEPDFRDGQFDYSYFDEGRGRINNFVVPLEVIYRNGAPKGSSLFRTLDRLEEARDIEGIKSLLSRYGLTTRPTPGDMFPQTGFDFTTKLEPKDRRITDEEAYRISGLTETQFTQLKELRQAGVVIVSKRTQEVGLDDFDGKHEYRFYNGIVEMADVFGTPDENRIMFNGRQANKEFLRQVYKAKQPDWVADVERAKAEAEERGIKDWKSLTTVQPRPLDPHLINLVGEMYASVAERYTGLRVFGARELDVVMRELESYYPS